MMNLQGYSLKFYGKVMRKKQNDISWDKINYLKIIIEKNFKEKY